jgi:ABC-type branched-subunit amino acid transport system substrate-binding protein
MIRKTLDVVISLIFMVSAFLIPFSKEGSAEEREIVIGSASDLSGPWAPTATGIATGRKAYARYVNEKLGGINGVKIKIIVVDTAYNIDREIAAYKKFRDEDKALFMINQNSGAAYAIELMMEESGRGMPHSHTAEPTAVFRGSKKTWYFASQTMPGDSSTGLLNYFLENKWKKKEKPRVALANSDNTPGQTNGIFLRDYLQQQKFPIVADLVIPPRPMDTTSYILNIKQANPDIIMGLQTDAGWTVMLKDKKRLDLVAPTIAGCCLDENALKVLGEAGLGLITTFPAVVWNMVDLPEVRLVHDLYKEWYPGEMRKENYGFFWGWMQSMIAVEAIKKASNKVGYDGLTKDIDKGRSIVRDVLEYEMRGFDCHGLTSPLAYTEGDHRAFLRIRVFEVDPRGEFKFMGWANASPLRPEQKIAKWWEDAIKGVAKK